MAPSRTPVRAIAVLASIVISGCGGTGGHAATGAKAPARDDPESSHVIRARADSARYPYTTADVHFMTRMIGHHAQAVVISRLAPSHGASPSIRTLAARIINGQEDEMAAMQTWLRDRGQPVPDGAPAPAPMAMSGADHHMHMPGMLTDAQLRQLDAARGRDFDRLFLTLMIQHHRGAVAMVEELFGTSGAAQDETVFRLASDVNVDQITEIDRMEKMLAALTLNTPSR
jgi:uncharacterized protein (DUF305 family)